MMQDDDGRLVAVGGDAMQKLWPGMGPRDARVLFRAALSAIEREGWKVVPVEPTEEMKDAGHYAGWHCGESDRVTAVVSAAWPAMLSAAPKQG